MTKPLTHCQDELQALELLTEVQQILANAINSLGNKTPPSIEADYLFHTALGMNRVADGFLHLRKAFRVSASKILVRPAIELLLYGSAGLKSKEFHFRRAYSEWLEDKKLFAKTPTDEAEADKALAELEQSFKAELPDYPIKRDRLSIKQASRMASFEHLYETQFAIYCQYTHGSLRALIGDLDEATDPRDTVIVSWCTLKMIDLLKENTPSVVPDMVPLQKRLLQVSGLRPEDVSG